ncbi:hypothetical protein [Nocardia australiensis]|uniref:hypothetical protein n=1 Tax=Nocardia australiensis TaxID=2887191 RepID=UPI001D13F8DA|nr:hypothetical protein [Nocardia australiensis]
MQRNLFRDQCIECEQEVLGDAGFIFNPGYANAVVCLDCLYGFYGEQRGFLRPLEGSQSRFAEWPKKSRIRD